MNFSKITLGELLSSNNETIKRNAFSILKQLHQKNPVRCNNCDWIGLNVELLPNEGYQNELCPKCGLNSEGKIVDI